MLLMIDFRFSRGFSTDRVCRFFKYRVASRKLAILILELEEPLRLASFLKISDTFHKLINFAFTRVRNCKQSVVPL